jgi:hypothetical protein
MTFDEMWAAAIADARRRLRNKPDAARLIDRVASPSFPGALALLAGAQAGGGRTGPEFRKEIASDVAGLPEVKKLGIDAATVEAVLNRLFVQRGTPSSTNHAEEVLIVVLEKALERQGLEVTRGEALEILGLLQTGQFYHDLVGTAGAIFATIPRLPTALLKDVPRLPKLPIEGVGGIVRDLFELIGALARVAVDLRDGKIDEPPATMTRTLALLYGLGLVGQVRDLLQRILDPGNRSVRLALLLYARSNGFDITEKQLDVVYDALIATDRPDLGPILTEALEVMKDRYGGGELEAVLAAIQRTGTPA